MIFSAILLLHAGSRMSIAILLGTVSGSHLMATDTGPGMAALPILLLSAALALLHIIGTKLPLFALIPLYRWTSFAGGVSITFSFQEVFPEPADYQAKQKAVGTPLFIIENHIYLMALLGRPAFNPWMSFGNNNWPPDGGATRQLPLHQAIPLA